MFIGYQTCGSSYNVCDGSSSSTDSPVPVIILICIPFIVWFFICFACFYWCRRRTVQSRQPVRGYVFTPPMQQPQYSYQQQPMQTPPTVTYANPNTYPHMATPIPNNYEKPPPSYEAASRDTRFTYPTSSAPMRDVP